MVHFEHDVVRSYIYSLKLNVPLLSYLERVEACDDPSVVHLTALGRMGKLALLVGARARAPLELPAHLQCQPLCVADVCHVQRHGNSLAKSIPSCNRFGRK